MSDVMLFGVLRMPYELAMENDLSRSQFYGRAQQAADELDRLTARVDALEATLRSAILFVEHYALRNKKWEHEGVEQDPSGVHATLAAARALLEKPHD